ncbi:hypothetical protein O1504_10880 [Bacteroides fragilis]|nr:hypothetical protein [Bacteroides fragilis]MCS2587471.1 hypothetical protein [Bacteroides fragilis]MCS2805669.1 hypothetical protein [Bacteroides fragilis]MCZ2590316.1 hypothetical protein [Bacteroides fragilis]
MDCQWRMLPSYFVPWALVYYYISQMNLLWRI